MDNIIRIHLAILMLIATGCTVAKHREESYVPSAKLVEIKKDTPIYSTWDRWDEKKSMTLLMGKNSLVENASLADILADDPDPEVVMKIKSYKKWQEASVWTGLGGLLIAGAHWPKKERRADGSEYDSANWTMLSIGVITTLIVPSLMQGFSLKYLEEAQGIHNARINQQISAMYEWSIQ